MTKSGEEWWNNRKKLNILNVPWNKLYKRKREDGIVFQFNVFREVMKNKSKQAINKMTEIKISNKNYRENIILMKYEIKISR